MYRCDATIGTVYSGVVPVVRPALPASVLSACPSLVNERWDRESWIHARQSEGATLRYVIGGRYVTRVQPGPGVPSPASAPQTQPDVQGAVIELGEAQPHGAHPSANDAITLENIDVDVGRGKAGTERRLECVDGDRIAVLEIQVEHRRCVRCCLRRHRPAPHRLLGWRPRIFEYTTLVRDMQQVRVHTVRCFAALVFGDGDLVRLGELMADSHAAMRDDFEITVPAIDGLVEIIKARIGTEGGVRMTGGGFGGCVVALLRPERVNEVIAVVEAQYPARFQPQRHVRHDRAAGVGFVEFSG